MIDPEDYILPREIEQQHERTAKEMEEYMRHENAVYALDFRPFGVEW